MLRTGRGGTDSNKALEAWSQFISSNALLERILVIVIYGTRMLCHISIQIWMDTRGNLNVSESRNGWYSFKKMSALVEGTVGLVELWGLVVLWTRVKFLLSFCLNAK